MNHTLDIFKKNSNSIFLSLIKREADKLPLIPFKTLLMIQEANGEQLILFELFNYLKSIEQVCYNFETFNLRLIVVVGQFAYIKKIDAEQLYIVKLPINNEKHYILLLKNDSIPKKDNVSEKVIELLDKQQMIYEEQVISTDLAIENTYWFVEKMLEVNLTIDEK